MSLINQKNQINNKQNLEINYSEIKAGTNIDKKEEINKNENQIQFDSIQHQEKEKEQIISNEQKKEVMNQKEDNKPTFEINQNESKPKEKNIELKTVDVVCEELLKCKNVNEIKEYLFDQLQLLDKKKRIDIYQKSLKEFIHKLDKDSVDLRKCNTAVSRAYIKKQTEKYTLEQEIKKLEKEVKSIKDNINFHQYMGDCYKEEINKIKENLD